MEEEVLVTLLSDYYHFDIDSYYGLVSNSMHQTIDNTTPSKRIKISEVVSECQSQPYGQTDKLLV